MRPGLSAPPERTPCRVGDGSAGGGLRSLAGTLVRRARPMPHRPQPGPQSLPVPLDDHRSVFAHVLGLGLGGVEGERVGGTDGGPLE